MAELDLTNRLLVGSRGDQVVLPIGAPPVLTPLQAKVTAAWLLVVAETCELLTGEENPVPFDEVLEAVKNT